jgi:methyl-galactoside transport system ATP-binding protein/inositol transport system ATP-binding protein
MKDIVKTFPGVQALRGVNLKVQKGEIHALLGENGAGKSTLMKCIAGIHNPTSGEIIFDGKVMKPYNTAEALQLGISMIHQELNPVLQRPIMENIWLGREPETKIGLIDHKKMYEMTKEVLKQIDMNEDPTSLVSTLTVAKVQMIEIAKAISYDSKLIIMDEPTSALAEREIKKLFSIMRRMKEQGKSIIYISHKLDEIYEIADQITVYRDGEYIGTEKTSLLKIDKLINMMVGRDVKELFPKIPCEIGDVCLDVKDLSCGKLFNDVSFNVRRGEIFGIAGLIGAGRSEVIETIFGIRTKTSGEIYVNGQKIEIKRTKDAITAGIALLTEDRRVSGIFPMLSVLFNMTIVNIPHFKGKMGLLQEKEMRRLGEAYRERLQVKTPGLDQSIENLSGGNQQKALVARWLMSEPDILLLDEPTRGIDVLTKSEIHRLISSLACEGKSIIMVSSELPEIMGMSDRIMVMHEGKVSGIFENSKDLSQELLMAYATNTAEDHSQFSAQEKEGYK